MNYIKWLNHHIIIYWMPLTLACLTIIYFSILENPFSSLGIPKGDLLNFNNLHIPAYFILSFLAGVAFRHTTKLKFHHYTLAILFAFNFGILMELMQGLVSDRIKNSDIPFGFNRQNNFRHMPLGKIQGCLIPS